MKVLEEANYALGDRAELDRLWAENGYWYFRNVLDLSAVAALRQEYVAEIAKLGLVGDETDDPVWNGGPVDDFPATFHDLHERQCWPQFVRHPAIKAFFEHVFADEVFWLPMDYYRILPPKSGPNLPRNIDVHQDGSDTPGVTFMTCWIPLNHIDVEAGGLYLASGQHKQGYARQIDGERILADGPIDPESWARADYDPGDVVIFSGTTPHYGEANRSNRFRMSLDIRAVRCSTPLPLLGEVRSISADGATVLADDGAEKTLAFDDGTLFRAMTNPAIAYVLPVPRDGVAAALPPGSRVMATLDGDRTLLFRGAIT